MSLPRGRGRRGRNCCSRSRRWDFYSQLIIDLLDAFDLFDKGLYCDSILVVRRFAFQSHRALLNVDLDVAVPGSGKTSLDLTQQDRVFGPFLHPLPDVADRFLRLPLYFLSGRDPGPGHGWIDYD